MTAAILKDIPMDCTWRSLVRETPADGKITEPGIYFMGKDRYHADPCITPSLSCSIAKNMANKSPFHAKREHPRLNPAFEPKNSRTFDLGNVAHQLILGDVAAVKIIDPAKHLNKDGGIPKGWTNDKIKAARDQAHNEGLAPCLPGEYQDAERMVEALRGQLQMHEEAANAFREGMCEATLVWIEETGGNKFYFRIRLDWLHFYDLKFFDDYKSTENASPEWWGEKQIWNMGYDFQAAFYRRGIYNVLGIEDPRFRFVVQENEAPYLVCTFEPSTPAVDLAGKDVSRAIGRWKWCLANNRWPAYPAYTVIVDPPVYHEKRLLERDLHEEAYRETNSLELLERMLVWQAPHDWDRAAAGI